MKILHVLPAPSHGGGEKVAVELLNQAHLFGDQVELLCGWPVQGGILQQVDNRIPVHYLGASKRDAYLGFLPWLWKHRDWLQRFDVLHCHMTFAGLLGSAVYLYRYLHGRPCPRVVETNHAVGMPISSWRRQLLAIMSRLRDGLVLMAEDPFWTGFVSANPRLPVRVIANGISVPAPVEKGLRFDLASLGIPASPPSLVVGTIGHLRPERRATLYVEIFEKIRSKVGERVQFLMGGDGPDRQLVESRLSEKSLNGHFHLLGHLDQPAAVYPLLDLYISLGVGDIGGISMIEAAMCKVPVIGIQLNEAHLVSDKSWFWSDTKVENIADRAAELLLSQELREATATKQYQYAMDNFTSAAMYRNYHKFYEAIVNL